MFWPATVRVFPEAFSVGKNQTARRLQSEIGGEIVFFYHDSDHDPRETRTILRHRKTNEPTQLNFAFKNRIQRKFSPLYLKEIPAGWQDKTARQLPNYIGHRLIEIFQISSAAMSRTFVWRCIVIWACSIDIRVVRSSDPGFRQAACDIAEFFVDVPHEGEIVRARFIDGTLKLHERRRFVCHVAADCFHQEANQSHPRYPAALDAVCGALHALHCRRWRTRIIFDPERSSGN